MVRGDPYLPLSCSFCLLLRWTRKKGTHMLSNLIILVTDTALSCRASLCAKRNRGNHILPYYCHLNVSRAREEIAHIFSRQPLVNQPSEKISILGNKGAVSHILILRPGVSCYYPARSSKSRETGNISGGTRWLSGRVQVLRVLCQLFV